MGVQKDKKDKKDKNKITGPNKNAKLQLKGRIFMTNVTEVLSLAKQGKSCNHGLLWSISNCNKVLTLCKSSGKVIQA